ncbi:hypothetical protein J2W88_001763 [Acidovorax delafieldii]|uniref:Uncharacterized protein n=1 Tax=Acidovorax delafieldii TaxID=47920 RepID=A0AAJ2BV42_ACIDE|nr:hypothetical protein [Acidovorax delafieldii]MDR6836564.1 hypothetical protein [Acidovorax delafieldii]MDR7366055.1 hypothetical protein [Acidovorax delafieldii]
MRVCEVIDEGECWSPDSQDPWPDPGTEDVIACGAWIASDRCAPDAKTLAECLQRLERWVDWIPIGWQSLYLDMRCALVALGSHQKRAVWIHEPLVVNGGLVFDVDGRDRAVCGIVRKAWARSRSTCMGCGCTGKRRRINRHVKTLCARCYALDALSRDLDKVLQEPWDGDRVGLSPAWPRDLSPLIKVLIKEGARLGALKVESLVAGDAIPHAVLAWLWDVWGHVQRPLAVDESRTIR